MRFAAIVLLLLFIGGDAPPFGAITAAAPNCDKCQIELQSITFGVARGQTLRVTSFNGVELRSKDGARFKMLFAVVIVDLDGNVLAQGDEIAIEPGEFHSFDFHRDDLPLAGEPGTGRVQLRTDIRHRFFNVVDRSSINPANFPVSIELIDDAGETSVYANPKAFQIISPGKDSSAGTGLDQFALNYSSIKPVGLVRGQVLRICGSLLGDFEHPDLAVNIFITNSQGVGVHRVTNLRIGPSQTRCADVSRDAISMPGEADSGRLQLGGQITLTGNVPTAGILLSEEVFTAETGKTQIGLLVPAIQHIRVPVDKN